MDGLLSFPFCGKKSNPEQARKNCKVLPVVRSHGICCIRGLHKKKIVLRWNEYPLNYMGPNQGPYRPWYFAIHCQFLSQSIPSFSFTYDTYCPCILFRFHLFSVSFTSFTASEMLTSLLSPTFLSNTSTISHIPTQVVLFSPHAALTTDQASSSLLSG